jgi:ABC-type sugar transport system ATPase subunit
MFGILQSMKIAAYAFEPAIATASDHLRLPEAGLGQDVVARRALSAEKRRRRARASGIGTVYQDLALIDELSVYHNLFLRRERLLRPLPLLDNRKMKREARAALDEIGINIPRIDVSVARLSGGQRQAIAVARTVNSDADIILLDEPLAAMGAKEGAQILDLVTRLKAEGRVSIIMILHNYVHVLEACDRVSMIQDGVIALDKPTADTSVEELTEIVVNEYRRARLAAHEAEGPV